MASRSGATTAITRGAAPTPPRPWALKSAPTGPRWSSGSPARDNIRVTPYDLSCDRSRMDLAVIHGFLSTCYWSPRIRLEVVRRAIEHSEVAGVFDEHGAQVGFARAVTDYA